MDRKEQRRHDKLNTKRSMVLKIMKVKGFEITEPMDHIDIVIQGYLMCGKKLKLKATYNGLHAHYSAIAKWLMGSKKKARSGKRNDKQSADKFYRSYEWRRARYDALQANDGRCELCGRAKIDGIVLNVDHIKPLKSYWDLRIDPVNLQVLCNECNHGKSNRDMTDWRNG